MITYIRKQGGGVWEPPLFNYPAFCKVLSINDICQIIYMGINIKSSTSLSLKSRNCLVVNEFIKMFTNQNSSLKRLTYFKLWCSSDINSEFYYQLSQTCHNLQLLAIDFKPKPVSNDDNDNLPLSFVASFPNLQQVELSFFFGGVYSKNFERLQYVTFPKFQILNIPDDFPEPEYVINFLRINGKNLENIYFFKHNNVLNLSIAELCPNLKKLFVIFNDDELDTLRTIFNSCRYLESIKFYCGKSFLSEKEILEIVAKHSPENFYELKICNKSDSNLLPEDLETFFINWKSRTSKKSLSLIIIKDYNYNSLEINEENIKIINHYKNSVLSILKLENMTMMIIEIFKISILYLIKYLVIQYLSIKTFYKRANITVRFILVSRITLD
ncbi:hypothetical protein C1645_826775 [Glomus cerebriforme]|uniref:F-box domain-containing protein n=1 Tax=Glomus cerebriforme TaxID=658196 RepID=A0A397STE3_9GLOM|nr:hypothetical protein C1645_826775 [Glomus cerebriforme]